MNLPSNIIFLLGAGFNVDAASEAGNPDEPGHSVRYPIVSELSKICFQLYTLPFGKTIEDLFQESIDKRENKPLDIL